MRPLRIALSNLSKQDSVEEITFVWSLWHIHGEKVGSPPNPSASKPFQPR